INCDENPLRWEPMGDIIGAAKAEDYDEDAHVYSGVPRDSDDGVIIRRAWIMAAIDAHLKLGFEAVGNKRIGFDVADSGDDKCANVYAHGSVVSWADEWKAAEDESLKSCTRTYSAARERGAGVTYDSIGVGAGCGAKFGEINETRRGESDNQPVSYEKFNAGGAVFEPDEDYSPGTTNKDM
ncbi:hypothetical protein OY671_009752, partial [Metschnikowia pulcherrima]